MHSNLLRIIPKTKHWPSTSEELTSFRRAMRQNEVDSSISVMPNRKYLCVILWIGSQLSQFDFGLRFSVSKQMEKQWQPIIIVWKRRTMWWWFVHIHQIEKSSSNNLPCCVHFIGCAQSVSTLCFTHIRYIDSVPNDSNERLKFVSFTFSVRLLNWWFFNCCLFFIIDSNKLQSLFLAHISGVFVCACIFCNSGFVMGIIRFKCSFIHP